jgi:hypothetical protein
LLKSLLLLSLYLLSCGLSLSGLSLLLLHLSVLLLHLLHHLLDSESLSFIFILNLLLYLILDVAVCWHIVAEEALLIFGVEFPEFFEIVVLNKLLTIDKIEVEIFDIEREDFFSCFSFFIKLGVLNYSIYFCSEIFDIKQNIVMNFLSTSLNSDAILSPSSVALSVRQRPIDVYVDLLELKSSLVLCPIFNTQLNAFKQDVSLQILCRIKLYLDNEEILTRYVVGFGVDGALKHLELTLRAQFNALVYRVRTILELCRHVPHVHEVGDVSILYLVLVIFQFIVVIF